MAPPPEGLTELNHKRGSAKARITVFESYLTKFAAADKSATPLEILEIESKIQKAHEAYDKFLQHHTEIAYKFPDHVNDAYASEYEKFDSIFHKCMALANSIIAPPYIGPQPDARASSSDPRATPGLSVQHDSSVSLPKIRLPQFSGDYESWIEFKEIFESLIHSSTSLSSLTKFHHLRASLTGDALQVVKSFAITDASYLDAWATLCSRYDNNKLLLHNHIVGLFNIESIQKESSVKIRSLIDNMSRHLSALRHLKQPVEHWDSLLIHFIISKIDVNTTKDWECKHPQIDATYEDLIQFLRDRANVLETVESKRPERPVVPSINRGNINRNSAKPSNRCLVSTYTPKCNFCTESHYTSNCPIFLELNVTDRIARCQEARICLNCLRGGHRRINCKASACRTCGGKHNTLVHINRAATDKSEVAPKIEENKNLVDNVALHVNVKAKTHVLLTTVLVNVRGGDGQTHRVRALLDAASQSHFISDELVKRLGLPTESISLSFSGINDLVSGSKKRTTAQISSRDGTFTERLEFLVLSHITSVNPPIEISHISLPANIMLADPEFNEAGPVDMLLGSGIFWNLLMHGHISLGKSKPVLQNTRLGWVLGGTMITNSKKTNNIQCHLIRDIQDQLQQFWSVEECANRVKSQTSEERMCEESFVRNLKRDKTNRFIVTIPLKGKLEHIGNSYQSALRRLNSMERRFKNNNSLKKEYTDFMKEYERLGHMSIAKPIQDPKTCYYLPHHAVFNSNSQTTKMRVVFDGSARTSTGKSINDFQIVGPVIQDDLFSILIRFRSYLIAVSSDIAKMYLVTEAQRDLQRILWRESPGDAIKEYQLNTVTYGTAAASYLAIRCLHYLADSQIDLEVRNRVKRDFYVDDFISGANTREEAAHLCNTVYALLASAGFILRKWNSSDRYVLNKLECVSGQLHDFGINEMTKTLGLLWSSEYDYFTFRINEAKFNPEKITKRVILSDTAQTFDPLGFLAPYTVQAKMFLQELWSLKSDWDDPIDEKIATRCKTKVAPLKPLSVPRLELCAALLLARVFKLFLNSVEFKIEASCMWTDSSIVLGWLRHPAKQLQTFVRNRVCEITELTQNSTWRHVSTLENPADLLSRGVNAATLLNNELWWHGPHWLRQVENVWPNPDIEEVVLPELIHVIDACHLTTKLDPIICIADFSDLSKLEGVLAYVFKFIRITRTPSDKRQNLAIDKKNANLLLVRLTQTEYYGSELAQLTSHKSIAKKSSILSLNPFLKDGIIRVGGRLINAPIPYAQKHPILLPANAPFTKLLFSREHIRLLHAGATMLVNSIRDKYWVINARNLARKTVHSCMKCFRAKPKCIVPMMGILPKCRVNPTYPFAQCGMDYAGPFMLKASNIRNAKSYKAYICIFICMFSTAVHLEVVTSLSSDAFIATLRRFASRRGKPSEIYSDNGTNFVGAKNKLNELKLLINDSQSDIENYASVEGIKWHFSPPRAPHFGGIWEAAVKRMKYHIKRVVGERMLTYEDFSTFLCQVEAVLNSRPLSPISTDPNDVTPLSPAHFLVGRKLTSVIDEECTSISESRLSKFQKIQAMIQGFWKRWAKEYLNECTKRSKWMTNGTTNLPTVGQLVLIQPESELFRWQTGRITDLHYGTDGIPRVATLRTASGNFKRPLIKLAPLPVEQHGNE